jgi:hypothetical protein
MHSSQVRSLCPRLLDFETHCRAADRVSSAGVLSSAIAAETSRWLAMAAWVK